ncbi:MAG TPA: hypothetical protein VFP65_03035, partial [Anaeromyxobacteraceae bacterium]|nr:hypothetical protein [Anaeromyxobacteraceae bacterium]
MRAARLALAAAAALLAACAPVRPAGGDGAGRAVDAWLRASEDAGARRALESAADAWLRASE